MTLEKDFHPYRTFIPADICKFLGLTEGDAVRYELRGGEVVLKKSLILDMSDPSEKEHYALAEQSMTEWLDDKDDGLLPPWKPNGTV